MGYWGSCYSKFERPVPILSFYSLWFSLIILPSTFSRNILQFKHHFMSCFWNCRNNNLSYPLLPQKLTISATLDFTIPTCPSGPTNLIHSTFCFTWDNVPVPKTRMETSCKDWLGCQDFWEIIAISDSLSTKNFNLSFFYLQLSFRLSSLITVCQNNFFSSTSKIPDLHIRAALPLNVGAIRIAQHCQLYFCGSF